MKGKYANPTTYDSLYQIANMLTTYPPLSCTRELMTVATHKPTKMLRGCSNFI